MFFKNFKQNLFYFGIKNCSIDQKQLFVLHFFIRSSKKVQIYLQYFCTLGTDLCKELCTLLYKSK